MTAIAVTAHVGRDLIQSANIFKSAEVAVWEYIVNSIQYTSPGVPPVVTVDVNNRNKEIIVTDNGRGMNLEGLNNFFKMHGENIDRIAGKGGRGKFGTGKSAAFGIAKKLIVSSTMDGLRNTISLHRTDIDGSDGGEIPVQVIETNVKSEDVTSGTTIKIAEI